MEYVNSKLVELLDRISEMQERLSVALESGSSDEAERIVAELSVVERQRNRLVHRAVDDGSSSYNMTKPFRDQVIMALQLLGRPSSLGLVGDVSKVRWGEPILTRRIASLRRDEQASFESRPGARYVYVTPAISVDRFAAVRGTLALSDWPLEVRLVGPASPRVDLLHSIVNLCDELEEGRRTDAPWSLALERLLFRLGRTVPAALDANFSEQLDTEVIRQACRHELSRIETGDLKVRQDAAKRAVEKLTEVQRLFGFSWSVLGGEIAAGSSG